MVSFPYHSRHRVKLSIESVLNELNEFRLRPRSFSASRITAARRRVAKILPRRTLQLIIVDLIYARRTRQPLGHRPFSADSCSSSPTPHDAAADSATFLGLQRVYLSDYAHHASRRSAVSSRHAPSLDDGRPLSVIVDRANERALTVERRRRRRRRRSGQTSITTLFIASIDANLAIYTCASVRHARPPIAWRVGGRSADVPHLTAAQPFRGPSSRVTLSRFKTAISVIGDTLYAPLTDIFLLPPIERSATADRPVEIVADRRGNADPPGVGADV